MADTHINIAKPVDTVTPIDATTLAISIQRLHFHYPDGTLALGDIELQICKGDRVALIGSNGAGKSTLMLHLNGLLRGSGSIQILGQQLCDRSVNAIREQVGLVFQNPDDQLFMPTVFDEVAYAAVNAGYHHDEVCARVKRALDTVGMAGAEARHPSNLSLGQKKRVCIASVLVTDNHILALDEPSAGLDPAGRRDLIALLSNLASTLIVATHDLDLAAQLCPKTVVMQVGNIIRTGATSKILADAEFLAECGL